MIISEMLLGRRESGDTALTALMQRIKQAPPPLRSIDPAVPDAIEHIVSRCLQPDASTRFTTSADQAEALDGLETTGHARLAGAKLPARRRWLVPALAAAKKAVAEGRNEPALVPAARIFLAADKTADARAFSAELQKQVRKKARAYGKVIEGEIALKERRPTDAVDAFQEARKFVDLWLARFDLGVAYVEAGLYAQALSEFEICQKRRGEATALFLDERPTFRYLAPLNYWLGRAKEGLGMKPAAADHYKACLALRPEGL